MYGNVSISRVSAGHDHGAASWPLAAGLSAGERYRSRLGWALVLVAGFFVVELVAAVATGSLALLSDAGHMLTDVLAIGMALAAITAAARARARPRVQHSFGLYRLEILAALANALLLLGIAGYVLVEAVGRLREPPTVAGGPMLVVGVVGLGVTLTAFWLLRRGARESLNLRGAMLEVAFDALSSAGVIVAALVLLATGWPYADPLIAVAIGLAIIPRAVGFGRQAFRVLLQAAPEHIPVARVRADLAALDHVIDAHDVHVWTLTSGMEVVSAHLTIDTTHQLGPVLAAARATLHDRYGIEHATLQVEPSDSSACCPAGW
jgi:cobalt-zinc-cadmium efflux system protein